VSDPFRDNPVPRGALFALGGLVLFSLVAVIAAQLAGYKAGTPPLEAVVDQVDLRFVDVGGGEVQIFDADRQALLTTLAPGTENFIRGVVRGMARERRSQSLGRETPFRLARHSDGRLTLTDLATGRLIDLQAFGQTNADAFARLLTLRTADS
jgi:putative photosynthetic complex assembly protein